jgi:hypothetical protein
MHFYIMEKHILESDGQQYLQYQQNVQSQVLAWTTHKMWRNELADVILLIIWIFNGNTYVNKRNKTCTYSLPLKKTTYITKINDNIIIDSTKCSELTNY